MLESLFMMKGGERFIWLIKDKNFTTSAEVKLLKVRQETMNGLQALNPSLATEMVGDEADLASAHISQTQALNQRDKFLAKIKEIDEALGKN
jgi:RNA polymerase-binding transcription factor DksA